jgi:hypothetical protein
MLTANYDAETPIEGWVFLKCVTMVECLLKSSPSLNWLWQTNRIVYVSGAIGGKPAGLEEMDAFLKLRYQKQIVYTRRFNP